MTVFKNKTFAALLGLLFGSLGLHRFYLRGWKDKWGWLHVAAFPVSGLLMSLHEGPMAMLGSGPIAVSVVAAMIETLVIGLTPDDKWDAAFNAGTGRTSQSAWPVALILVLALALGATTMIAALARTFDLLFTGGAYG